MDRASLRKYIRTLLEAAVAGQAAAGQGLALLRSNKGTGVEYVLYDPRAFARLSNGVPADELNELDPTEIIYGYLDVRPHRGDCWDAAEVKFSAARKGYGPLVYELAMSDFGRLMSDHGAGTSTSARKVWQTYARRPDVHALPFDDIKNPKTSPKDDDCKLVPDFDGENAYLNQAYAGKGDVSGKAALMQAHKAFVKQMGAAGVKEGDVDLALRMMGDNFFDQRYRENM